MSDEHNPYRDDVIWPRENNWQASMAAATEDRRWEGRRIIGSSEWVGGSPQARGHGP
jgi:hypothetical protein